MKWPGDTFSIIFYKLLIRISTETWKLPWVQIPEGIQNWKRKKTTSGNGLDIIRRWSSKSDSPPCKRRGLLTPRYERYGEPPNQLPKISKWVTNSVLRGIRRESSKSYSPPCKRRGLLTPRFKRYGESTNQLSNISKTGDIFCTVYTPRQKSLKKSAYSNPRTNVKV